MKRFNLYILIPVFCCLIVLSVHTHEENFHAPGVKISPWAAQLQTFYKHLKTDPNAARAELQKIAQNVFDGHALANEWIPLYFRISLEGTEYLSDIKRVHELELRMLTAIDAEKYTKQIQHHREALEYYEKLDSSDGHELWMSQKTSSDGQEQTTQIGQEQETSEKAKAKTGHQHFMKFYEFLPDDVEAARKELDAFAALAFHGHPRTEDWKALFFRLSRQKEATVPEMIQLLELKKQMLKDTDSERNAKELASLESALKQFKSLAKVFEHQGILDTEKISFNMKPGK